MKDNHDLYLKCDVLLLGDVFEKLSSHCLSAPPVSWDAMLNITKVELELILDVDMCLFFEKGMSDGVCYIAKRCSKADNKYLKSYDPKQKSKYVINLGPNSLYGYAMSKFLPTGGFK